MEEATWGLDAIVGFEIAGVNLWRPSPLWNLIAKRTVAFMTGLALGHFKVVSVFLTPEAPDRTGYLTKKA